jgi:hypothetical protein
VIRFHVARIIAVTGLFVLASCSDPPMPDPVSEQSSGLLPCYKSSTLGLTAPKPKVAVFVMIDQTTGLDDKLRGTVTSTVANLLEDGGTFSISTFSAFSKSHFATIQSAGDLELPVPETERGNLSVRGLEALDSCIAGQRKAGLEIISNAIADATASDSSTFDNSEILSSLSQLSQAVKAVDAQEKLVLIVSDMLEHSSVTSFYKQQQLRILDVQSELEKAASAGLIGDYGEARIVIIGAGLLSTQAGDKTIRDAKSLLTLKQFWESWLASSNGKLEQYGQPDLLVPVTK